VQLWGKDAFREPSRAVRLDRPAVVPAHTMAQLLDAARRLAESAIDARPVVFDVARDFAPMLGALDERGEPFDGERLCRDLRQLLETHDTVTVRLDDVDGYTWDFLDDAFGGLLRVGGLSLGVVTKKLRLESMDNGLVREIWRYIEHAAHTG
jgi:hypothetical protein